MADFNQVPQGQAAEILSNETSLGLGTQALNTVSSMEQLVSDAGIAANVALNTSSSSVITSPNYPRTGQLWPTGSLIITQ